VVPPAVSISPELAQLLQSMSHDLANPQQSTEQMKVSQEQNAHDIARVSEQLKAAQAQMARDNANAAEQLRMLQQRTAHLTTAPSEQNVQPKASAPPKPIPAPRPKPLPAISSPQARA
jgi:septal ring factor EnvC (AmiA/AmiB activator)